MKNPQRILKIFENQSKEAETLLAQTAERRARLETTRRRMVEWVDGELAGAAAGLRGGAGDAARFYLERRRDIARIEAARDEAAAEEAAARAALDEVYAEKKRFEVFADRLALRARVAARAEEERALRETPAHNGPFAGMRRSGAGG